MVTPAMSGTAPRAQNRDGPGVMRARTDVQRIPSSSSTMVTLYGAPAKKAGCCGRWTTMNEEIVPRPDSDVHSWSSQRQRGQSPTDGVARNVTPLDRRFSRWDTANPSVSRPYPRTRPWGGRRSPTSQRHEASVGLRRDRGRRRPCRRRGSHTPGGGRPRVIVADSRAFPRDKVCGDFVSPVAIQELASLGITRRTEWRQSTTIRSAAVHLDGEHLLTSVMPRQRGLPRLGRVIPRKSLDAWLVAGARAAGARVLERSRVIGFAADRRGIVVTVQHPRGERTLRARVLIGADGSSSLVARLLRGDGDGDHDRIIAIRGYFEDVQGPADRADLYFASDSFPGYCWVFPSGKGVGERRRRGDPEDTPAVETAPARALASIDRRGCRAEEAPRRRPAC